MSRPVAILGNGGHAMVIKEALELAGVEVAGCFTLLGEGMVTKGPVDYTLGMGRRARRRVCVELTEKGPGLTEWVTVIHPSAIVSKSAEIGGGAQIMAGAIIQAGAKIGKHAIINTGAQVDHGCIVGDFAHICPGAILCADVTVEEGAMVESGFIARRGDRVINVRGQRTFVVRGKYPHEMDAVEPGAAVRSLGLAGP